jgi:hypothetical protein
MVNFSKVSSLVFLAKLPISPISKGIDVNNIIA